jgi:ssDNA-binding Zn-finger/Zn-ribbon topoisomerase 1
MPTNYRFVCTSCRYEVNSDTRPERGPLYATAPMLCRKCQIVDNVVIWKSLTVGDLLPKVCTCPRCQSAEYLEPWDVLTCPKCDGKVKGISRRGREITYGGMVMKRRILARCTAD